MFEFNTFANFDYTYVIVSGAQINAWIVRLILKLVWIVRSRPDCTVGTSKYPF